MKRLARIKANKYTYTTRSFGKNSKAPMRISRNCLTLSRDLTNKKKRREEKARDKIPAKLAI